MQNSFKMYIFFFFLLFCWYYVVTLNSIVSVAVLILMFRLTYSVVIIMIYNEKFHVLNCSIFLMELLNQ